MVKEKKVFLFTSAITLISFIILFTTIMSTLPSAAIKPNKQTQLIINQLYPQSWGFFSKDPESEILNVYDAHFSKVLDWPNNKIKHLFGLNRIGRGQGIELSFIFPQLPTKDKWEDFKGNENPDDFIFHKVKNKVKHPTLEGKYIITYEKVTPWAWAKYTDKKRSKVKYIGIDVR